MVNGGGRGEWAPGQIDCSSTPTKQFPFPALSLYNLVNQNTFQVYNLDKKSLRDWELTNSPKFFFYYSIAPFLSSLFCLFRPLLFIFTVLRFILQY